MTLALWNMHLCFALAIFLLLPLRGRSRAMQGAVLLGMLALATLAFGLGLLESENYWDYLLDPFVVIYCWLALLVSGIRRLWSSRGRARA